MAWKASCPRSDGTHSETEAVERSMAEHSKPGLSRREQEILNIVYRDGSPTATEILEAMASPPSNGAVRATLRVLVNKGYLKHRQDGPRYRYAPTLPRRRATTSALKHVLDTFFGGSTEEAMMALLELKSCDLTDEQRARIKREIDQCRREGR